MTKKERIILLLLASINFTHILDFMIMMPLGNFLMPHFNITPHQFSIIVSSYSFAAFATGIVAAFFVDRFDRKKVLLFGYSGFIIGTILCGLAPGYELLIAARIMAGLFGGLIGAQVLSIVADSFGYEKRGRAMGYLMSAFSVASVVGVPFSLYLAKIISWHAPFIFVGILGIIIVPMIIRFMPAMNTHLLNNDDRPDTMEIFTGLINNKQQLLALSFSAFMIMGHFLIIPFINPFMEFNVGFTKDQTPVIYMVGGAATLISSPLFGKMADKYGKLRVFGICAFISLFFIFTITNMPAINFYLVLLVMGLWFVVANGRTVAAQALISNVVTSQQRGSFMSFNSSIQQAAIGLASVTAGYMVQKDSADKILHYNWVGYLSLLVIGCCIYIGYKLGERKNN